MSASGQNLNRLWIDGVTFVTAGCDENWLPSGKRWYIMMSWLFDHGIIILVEHSRVLPCCMEMRIRMEKQADKKEKNYRIIRDEFGRFQKVRADVSAARDTEELRKEQAAYRDPVWQRSQTPVKRVQQMVNRKPAGKVSSIIYSLFGGIFTACFGVAFFVLIVCSLFEGQTDAMMAAAIVFPFLAGSAACLWKGLVQSKRLQRFYRYVRILDGRSYAMLEEFSAAIGKSIAYVRRDVQKMIDLRMFPHGRVDGEGTCLILNDETWQQYLALKERTRQQAMEEEEQKRIEKADPFRHEVNRMMQEGDSYLAQIRAANDAIPGEEISRKLDELELIIRKIFEQLKKQPEKLSEMNRFMDYYLPTTLKLVTAYREFDEQAVAGDNITSGKQEIENTLDTINKAFVNLFDSLFAETALDISTDISVLKTVLAQEGLTDSDFKQ